MKKIFAIVLIILVPVFSFGETEEKEKKLKPSEIVADFTDVAGIKKAGKDAEGKYARLRLKLVAVGQKTIVFIDKDRNYIKVNFTRPQVRNIRSIRRNHKYEVMVNIRFVYTSGLVEYDFVTCSMLK